jgi:uncharacterized protein (TIGR00251 family)
MATIQVKVVPGARKDRVVGRLGNALKVQVTAPPERGKANEAVCELLAKFFGVKEKQVIVTAGHASPRKTVRIESIEAAAVERIIAEKLAT